MPDWRQRTEDERPAIVACEAGRRDRMRRAGRSVCRRDGSRDRADDEPGVVAAGPSRATVEGLLSPAGGSPGPPITAVSSDVVVVGPAVVGGTVVVLVFVGAAMVVVVALTPSSTVVVGGGGAGAVTVKVSGA